MARSHKDAHSQVDWYGEEVTLLVEGACQTCLTRLAHRIEERAKVNIVDNDQVDTGFLLNSVYVVTPTGSSYAQTWPSGTYPVDPKKHDGASYEVEQVRSPQAALPPDAMALVAAGAEYAIYQELARSFLYRAVEQVQGEVTDAVIADAEIRRVKLREE